MLARVYLCILASLCEVSYEVAHAYLNMCAAVRLYAHLTLDDVIVLVDLQDISRVAGDGAAVSIEDVVARATAL